MSIRLKLIFTYILTVVISVFIVVMLLFTMMGRVASSVMEVFVENSPIDEVAHEMIDILVELRHAEEYSEKDLVDVSFIEDINKRLQFFNSGLIVLYKDSYLNESDYPKTEDFYKKLVYISYAHDNMGVKNDSADTADTTDTTDTSNSDSLPSKLEIKKVELASDNKLGVKSQQGESMMFDYNGDSYFYFNVMYHVNDQDVIYYFVSKINRLNALNISYVRGIIIFVAILVVLLIAPVFLIIQKDIVKPLRELEKGSRHISEGNLDFRLNTKSRNEVGRVIFSYEKMRQELKKSIQKQVKYENNRKELISSISHDLKTPITSIKGYVEGILDGVANTDEKRERYLQVIHQKSLDMDNLIDDLFLFSKLDLHKMPFEFDVIHFSNFIKDISEELTLEYQGQGKIIYEMEDLSDTKPLVLADADQIKRVVMNLVQNSIKYNRNEEKQVVIQVSNEADNVSLVVKDNGIGMTEDELKHAFDMFYRSDESRNTKTGGSGLGLAIVKQIVLEHQGSIKAKSSPEKGTQIKIVFKKEKMVEKEEL